MPATATPHQSLDQFLDACGAGPEFRFLVEQAEQSGSSYKTVFLPFALIGRAVEADVTLNHPDVSFRHGYVQILGGRVLCVDLESRTGTHWQKGARQCGWVDDHERLRIGPFTLQFPNGTPQHDPDQFSVPNNP